MTSLGLTLGNWIGLGFIVLLAAGLPASLTLARRHEAKRDYGWEGQIVTLHCIPSWHYQAAETWGCSIRDYEGDPR